MSQGQLPLLLFPAPSAVDRQGGTSFPPSVQYPSQSRQAERLTPRFQSLQTAFDARRLELQATAPNSDPDMVVVFETVGPVEDFISSAARLPGLEWLAGMIESQIAPDEDFYVTDEREKPLSGKLFLLGSNRLALDEMVRLWDVYKADSRANLGAGLSAWKQLFAHLKEVRFWGPQDRLAGELRQTWIERLEDNTDVIRFEIEAWCFSSIAKNNLTTQELRSRVEALNGRLLDEQLLIEIAYHGFLVEMPAAGIRQLLGDAPTPLLLSDRVMFFRPQGQAITRAGVSAPHTSDSTVPQQLTSGNPIIAMLDGLPLSNHPRLAGRLIVEDPENWSQDYPALDRVHGTSMASLIAWGELDGTQVALPNPIYVHPILRPDATSNPRQEQTPDDRLLLDVVHLAVRRMFEGSPGVQPTAPTVKVINLSVGDKSRPFAGDLSPWARLLDWLSHKYKVLFIVSTGNQTDQLTLAVPRQTLAGMSPEERGSAATRALLQEDSHRRLIAPAESVNAVTVGACFSDGSILPTVGERFTLFPDRGIAPYSRLGPGFRRSVKPDILLPGGRMLYAERPTSPTSETHMSSFGAASGSPGHRVAAIPSESGDTIYTRGTSNAAALATRGAAQAFSVIEVLRAGAPAALPSRYDAVLIKALLGHGANVGAIEQQVLAARPDVDQWYAKRRLVSRYAGYGVADIDRALRCSEQRATILGVGELGNKKALEFRVPIPEALNASLVKRRLTVTLAWLTPTNPRHSKYRVGRLWVDLPGDPLRLKRLEGESKQIQLGTLQHKVLEGESAVPIVPDQSLVVRVNCVADAGRLVAPVEFALCVSLEVAEGIDLPIYEQVRERIGARVVVTT